MHEPHVEEYPKMISKSNRRSFGLVAWFICFFLTSHQLTGQTHASIVINEIHYDPDEPARAVEFIELYNQSQNTIGLSGWYFGDGVFYEFPEGTLLSAHDTILIVQDVEAFLEKYTASRRSRVRKEAVHGPFEGRLDNDGETIALRESGGSLVDQVKYRMGFPWPIVGDPVHPNLPGSGPSSQLVNPLFDNELAAKL
jgi:hypothetical protein